MQRIAIAIDGDLLAAVDGLMARSGYASRSEAFRDLARDMMDRETLADPKTECVAALSFVYDRATRALASRLTHAHHDRHDLPVASLHVRLDREACLEVSVLHGPSGAIEAFSDALSTQRGGRYARLHAIPVRVSTAGHKHGGRSGDPSHFHA